MVQTRINTQEGDKVLVTGGSGFLGQHIVSQLQIKAPHVQEIRVLDLKPYQNNLGHSTNKTCSSIIGSMTDFEALSSVVRGVDSVYHIAGKISYGTFPDFQGMREVNVKGTSNLIKACIENDVTRLIYCSTVDVVVGYDEINNGSEVTTRPPADFLFPGYPETKYQAECMVLAANGSKTKNGKVLNTLSLRANVMYGEGDPYYVSSGLRNARDTGGRLYQVGDGSALFQPVYVGNTAWAFICADNALKRNSLIGGRFYFIPDHTPPQNTFKFLEPFLVSRGYRLSTFKLPYRLVYRFLLIAEFFVKLVSPFVKFSLPTESYSVRYINMNLYFSGERAKKELEFIPPFSPEESKQKCMGYYRSMVL